MVINQNLQLLGLQAIPKLAKRFNIDLDGFLTYNDLYGTTPEQFNSSLDKCEKILRDLICNCGVSWWDIYSNSDIGMERIALARDICLQEDDTVLEIGCGRRLLQYCCNDCLKQCYWFGHDEWIGSSRLVEQFQRNCSRTISKVENCSLEGSGSSHSIERGFRQKGCCSTLHQELSEQTGHPEFDQRD